MAILELKEHRDVWPKVAFTRTITLQSSTLATLFVREKIDASRYDAIVMDTQGSELLVLRGAEPLLGGFNFIKTEAPERSGEQVGFPVRGQSVLRLCVSSRPVAAAGPERRFGREIANLRELGAATH